MADRQQGSAERGWKAFLEQEGVELETPRKRSSRPGRSLPHALVAALGTAALITPLAVAQGDDPGADAAARGDVLRQEVRNGTTRSETEIIGRFNASTGAKGGYVTRQSNTQTGAKAGGGAIYGCRGAAGGTAAGSAPCVRAKNLANGFAFEFASTAGPAGLFEVGAVTDAPFITNGRGLVANLNADLLDGKSAGDFLTAGSKVADADLLDGKNSTEFLGATAKAADANLLDGKNSTEFLGATAKAADANLLDGKNSTEFASASDLGGAVLRRVLFRTAATVADQTVLDLGGLQLQASCTAGVTPQISVVAKTTVNDASLKGHTVGTERGVSDTDTGGDTHFDNQGGDLRFEEDNFDTTDAENIGDESGSGSDSVSGQLTYVNPNGTVVTVVYTVEEDPLSTTDECLFAGTATAI